jgi:transposase-like protein
MCKDTTLIDEVRAEIHLSLDELAQRGAQRMLEAALQAEVDDYIRRHSQERDENNRAQVVCNGRAWERTIRRGAGTLKFEASRVNDKRAGQKFSSNILPPYMRKTPRLEEAVPVLYLRGLSTGDFQEALAQYSVGRRSRQLILSHDHYTPAGCQAGRVQSVAQTAVTHHLLSSFVCILHKYIRSCCPTSRV